MKGLNEQLTELLIANLNERINEDRTVAEEYEKAGNTLLAMIRTERATENEKTLHYLMGMMNREKS